MIARTADGGRRAFMVEWKYAEVYRRASKHIPARSRVYDSLITSQDSPFKSITPSVFYFEPFYQLMRHTLLGWQISKNKDHGCTSYRHVLVVPEHNAGFRLNVSAPLPGASVSEAWLGVLKEPEFFLCTTPVDFMRPAFKERDTKALTTYLQRRYWSGDVGLSNAIA